MQIVLLSVSDRYRVVVLNHVCAVLSSLRSQMHACILQEYVRSSISVKARFGCSFGSFNIETLVVCYLLRAFIMQKKIVQLWHLWFSGYRTLDSGIGSSPCTFFVLSIFCKFFINATFTLYLAHTYIDRVCKPKHELAIV